MGVRTEERGVRVGFIHAGGLKTLRFGEVAKDFKNEYMQVSQAVHAALLADPVAGAWADSMKGQAGVLVSAGPSLSKNAHVLSDKGLSDRFVTVATAAAAGSLRAMDLRPQLVATTSQLSAATRQWLASFNANSVGANIDVSIAVGDAANKSGATNMVHGGGKYKSADLGARADEVGVIVASLVDVADSIVGYILLRYLGCDPVVLVGFDLAFIDGVAHAKGNELDLQWSTQISTVRSWDWWHTQRIFGNSKQLQREQQTNESGVVGEVGGLKENSEDQERSVVTNQALRQERALLEAAFAQDVVLGLRVIDATEGGVTKRHALVEPLAQCLATYALKRNPKVKWNQRGKGKVMKAQPSADVVESSPSSSDAGAQNIASTQKSLSNITTEQIAPRVVAVIAIDPLRGGTGVERSLELEFGGRAVLRRTVDRLLLSQEIEHVCLVAPEHWDHREALDGLEPNSHLHIVYVADSAFGPGHRDIQSARAWSDSCSRGGIANLCVFDEVFSAKAALLACEHVHANAVLVCGADWSLVAVDESWGVRGLMERWRASARDLKFVCSLAAPGIGACFLPIESVRLLASGAARSIGQWIEERADDRNAGEIIDIPDFVAAVSERLVMDTPRCIQRIRRALEPLLHGAEISADAQFEALARHASAPPTFVPQFLTIELNTGRRGCGLASPHRFGTLQRPTMTPKRMDRILARVAEARDVVVTLGGAGDPLVHPDVVEFAKQIRKAGALAISVRSELLSLDALEKLAAIDADVVTVDLHATNASEFVRMMGFDRFAFAQNALETLMQNRRAESGAAKWLARPWVLPRIERLRDMVDRIAAFGERWRDRAGGYCVDSPPQIDPWGDIIADAPLSAAGFSQGSSQSERLALTVLSDGRVPAQTDDLLGTTSMGNVDSEDLLMLFRSSRQHRARSAVKHLEKLSAR